MRGLRPATVLAVVALLAATLVATPGGAAAELTGTVTPAEDLIDGQSVHVAITGATPGEFAYVQLCAAGGGENLDCDQDVSAGDTVDDEGNLAFDIGLDAVFTTFNDTTVDCRIAPGCRLVTVIFRDGDGDDQSERVENPVTFRPDGPLLPPPLIAINPSLDLVDGTIVRVTGSGFVPGSGVQFVQCKSPTSEYTDCESSQTYVQAGSDGTFTTDLYVAAVIFTDSREQFDCRTAACGIIATRTLFATDPRHTARAPLAFRPDGPLRPPPVLTVEPDDALVDGQEVQVSGTGFRPGPVVIAQCAGTGSAFERCSGGEYLIADVDGAVSTTLKLGVLARVAEGFVDCRAAPGCSVVASNPNNGQSLVEVPVAFDPEGPEPDFPELIAAPDGPLDARSGTIVTGHGFDPGTTVSFRQCEIVDGWPGECSPSGYEYAQVDDRGDFVAGLVVTALIGGLDGAEFDCRRVQCGVVADAFDGYPGIAPLNFGEPAPRRGRYLASVFDDVDLTEGVVYRRTTNSRGVAVDLALDIYRPAGDTGTRRPAVVWMFGGYFGSGERTQLRDLARALARRGYVSVAIDYRTRPEIFSGTNGCVFVGGVCLDPTQLGGAITDARDDARAAMVWLHEHAAEYGIEPRAISAAGWSAGAITALGLAHDASGERPAESIPAAAVSLAGILSGIPHAGDPPSMMLGGNHDSLLPMGAQIAGCGTIVTAGSSCEFVAYAGLRPAPEADDCVLLSVPCTYVLGRDGEHGFLFPERPDVIDRMSKFLARHVLKPLGYFSDRSDHRHHRRPHRPHGHHDWDRRHHR